ncbi:MAG: RHS repeat-associated core domain-containing protein [Burkholderiales bacterium]
MNLQPVVQTLLACESAASVIATRSTPCTISRRYCPYGNTPTGADNTAHLGYHGELLLPVTSLYMLGNGYRAYSPSLRRFLSSDSYSPFGRGGLNAYAAFSNNPINFKDPDGHAPAPLTLAKTKSLLDSKASLIAGLQQDFSSQENLNGHRVLQSLLPERPGRDLAALHSKADVAPANFSIIGSAKDLAHIGRRPQNSSLQLWRS